jgi:ElaB/YqjD/DUF883 family membrane-anchored ribosome-binding protein
MTQEMTSFVLRFVREVSEEQGARWRGLIQHVQSGAEHNFNTFADAVKFMQGRVVESTARALEQGEQMVDNNPFAGLTGEMARLWGDLGPKMVEMWSQAAEQAMNQSLAFRSQVDQAVATTLETWGLPTGADQDAMLEGLARLGEQVDQLASRVAALESQLAAQHRSGESDPTENT